MKVSAWISMICLMSGPLLFGQSIDDATLNRYLTQNFIADESMRWEKIDGFKQRFAVADDQLHRVLMEIYREAEDKRSTLTPKTLEWNNNNRKIEGVLGWLPKCGDIPVKDFLMNYATTQENDSWLRRSAILSYLREGNGEESKNALLRFLVEDGRMNHMERLSLYEYARMAYDAAPTEKKEAILAALIAAANKEEGKIEFMKVDKILSERNASYRHSRERLAMLERHSLEPPTTNLYTDRDLKAALQESRTYKTHTSITTNLAVLKSRDFKLPQSDLATNDLSEAGQKDAATVSKTDVPKHGLTVYALLALATSLLLGFGAWKLHKG